MIFVDDILTYFRSLGHAAEYGTLTQLNEQLTNVDYAASTDGMVVFVRLIGEQRTVDGHDQCDIAVHLSWLCPLDFDGETMLSTQEQAKDTLKAWINHLRGGNTVTVSDDARWQFGYDDFAENVAWVAVRVTLTAAAADCVPLVIPEPKRDYMYFEALEYSTVKMVSTLETAPDLEYSIDGETWREWPHTTAHGTHTFDTITLGEVGVRVYLRGDNPDGLSFIPEGSQIPSLSNFAFTGKIKAGGNIMSLLDKTMALTEVPDGGFPVLFADVENEAPNTALVSPPDMSRVVKVGKYGCTNMFYLCTSLLSAAPMDELKEIGEEGCVGMYIECTSLVSAADMPKLETVGNSGCLAMYAKCTSLASAADMPAVSELGEDGLIDLYGLCTFAMSDDGEMLNFAFPEPPITTVGENPRTYATAYDIAEWMGNTNGF